MTNFTPVRKTGIVACILASGKQTEPRSGQQSNNMPQYTQRERGKAGQQQGQPNVKRDLRSYDRHARPFSLSSLSRGIGFEFIPALDERTAY